MSKPLRSSRITASKLNSLTILFLLAAPVIVLFYSFFVFNPRNADNVILYVLQVTADAIGIVTLLTLWLTILLDVLVPSHHRKHSDRHTNYLDVVHPTIDVLITAAGEPIEIVSRTMRAAVAIEYPHYTYILDDGKSAELKSLCADYGVGYISRFERKFAKAGNVNNGLQYCTGEFFIIFDADQIPRKDFISRLLPYMENPKLAMVQSPQYFANTDKFIAAGTAQAQEIFYKHVCPSKNISDSAFCVGTNMIFRRKAIDEVGGIAEISHSEDIWTSYLLHERGWSTLFVNEILAFGQAPSTIVSYFKQQLRWARGGLGMLFFSNPLFSKKLSLDQKFQYFSTNIFYLVGISVLVYMLLPIVYLLFNIKPLKTENGIVWLLHYLPYFFLYYGLSFMLLGKLRIATIATSLASFYPYVLAVFTTLFGTKQEWIATTTRTRRQDPLLKWIWPHLFLIILTVFSLVIGWYEPTNFWATLFNTGWAVWNMYLLILFLTGEQRIVLTEQYEPSVGELKNVELLPETGVAYALET
jgi:cellulose synthase (UDP-forming)